MKRITFWGIASLALISLAQPTWAGPRGGGVGFGAAGNVGGGGRVGGFAGGGSRAAPAFSGGSFRAAPASRGAYFTGRNVGGVSREPSFYYGAPHSAVRTFRGVRPRRASTTVILACLLSRRGVSPRPQSAL